MRRAVFSLFNFHLLPTWFFATGLYCPVMTETAQPKRGGKPFHSILEPHFTFIHQQRQRRKTWQEIADLLFTEKGLHVTFYAPYSFYRRQLKRAAKPHWESKAAMEQPATVKPPAPAQKPAQAATTTTNPYGFNLDI
jgi:hypothetical protein